MHTDPGEAARIRQRRTVLACLATVIVVAAVVAALVVVGGNGFPAGNGETAVSAGAAFPDVTIEGSAGVTISTASLTGKPTLVWFSDSSCPDVKGLRRVAGFDDETGGDALRVVMVLLDQRAPSSRLAAWRDTFGRPDWLIAPDRGGAVSAAAGVRMPETRFLLDERATIIDTTSSLIDDAYVNLLRQRAHT